MVLFDVHYKVEWRTCSERLDIDNINQLRYMYMYKYRHVLKDYKMLLLITADGKISRLSTFLEEEKQSFDKTTQQVPMDFDKQLRESQLMDDFEEMEAQIMQEEVRALK